MLRIKLLRYLLILSLGIAVLFPGYEYFFVFPAYNKLLTRETENEAVRYARLLVRALALENQPLTREQLTDEMHEKLHPENRDESLIKLRIFSSRGEVIFSTRHDEIGDVNDSNYFQNIVARGQVYSRTVNIDQTTAEGEISQSDIVETYVPFMIDDVFGGAVEIYYDITANVAKVRQLSLRSLNTTVLMSLGFLLAISTALYRAHRNLLERDQAEESLRLANEDLEHRVAERTRELSDINQQLMRQITERNEAQKALREALDEIRNDREKLEGILGSVPDGVLVTDGELKIMHMNAAAESILDTSLAKMLGRSIGNLSRTVDFRKKVGEYLYLKRGSGSFDFEIPASDSLPSGTYQVRISRLDSALSTSPGVILLISDVSKEREVERMKNAFLGMAAHELNTPLTTIIGFSELLTAKETAGNFNSEQQRDYLQLIHEKALALGGLIDDLLDVTRIESGQPLSLNYQEFSFSSMLGEVIDSYRDKLIQHHFEVALLPEGARLCADRTRLKQVVDHLLSNAIKYSPNGGCVRVVLTRHDDKYQLCIEDQGIGMQQDQLEHIFDRFYRADSSDTAVQGVGLGMSIVRYIVLAHHGEILVDSHPGKGTKVCILLPVTPPTGGNDMNLVFAP
ncbi:MAG: ATP-binding protein [Desulfuromonadales bacterium]